MCGLKRTGNRDSVNRAKQFDQPLLIEEQVCKIRKKRANTPIWQTDEMAEASISDDGIQARTTLDFQLSNCVTEGTERLNPAIPSLVRNQMSVGTREMNFILHGKRLLELVFIWVTRIRTTLPE